MLYLVFVGRNISLSLTAFSLIYTPALFFALFCTYAWLKSPLTLVQFLLRVNRELSSVDVLYLRRD